MIAISMPYARALTPFPLFFFIAIDFDSILSFLFVCCFPFVVRAPLFLLAFFFSHQMIKACVCVRVSKFLYWKSIKNHSSPDQFTKRLPIIDAVVHLFISTMRLLLRVAATWITWHLTVRFYFVVAGLLSYIEINEDITVCT